MPVKLTLRELEQKRCQVMWIKLSQYQGIKANRRDIGDNILTGYVKLSDNAGMLRSGVYLLPAKAGMAGF